MSNRSATRPVVRRTGAVLVIAAGLSVVGGGVAVATPMPSPSIPVAPAASVVGLQRGDFGEEVKQLQEALIRVGVGVRGGVDGYFGSATQASVKAWQNHKGLAITGVVDEATAVSLGLATTAPSAPAAGGVLANGARGRAVAQLQLALINSGYVPTGGVDGIFGAATEGQLRRYQQDKGLTVTGQGDSATLQALGIASGSGGSSGATSGSGALARGARGTAVVEMQYRLIRLGINVPGGADGIFGAATEAALKSFQSSQGLEQTGTLGPRTSAALLAAADSVPQGPFPGSGSGSGGGSSSSPYIGLKLGSRGTAVKAVQQAIAQLGFYVPGGADGIFGTATQSVVMLVQRSNGIPGSGTIDAATARLLGLNGENPNVPDSSGSTAEGFARYDERGARVVALQQALMNAGIALRGGADGNFGSGTAGAVITFQRAQGLPATGKVDSATAAALGLSPMAVPAAPSPPVIQIEARPVQSPCYYGDSWGAPRGNGRVHLGVDIVAKQGQELYAVTTGRISQIYIDSPGSLSGNGLKIARPDGTYFFYAHLSAFAPGIDVGAQVTAGQLVGYVGSTGNSATPHLHLEVHPGGGSAVNPYPIVKALGAC